MNQSVVEHKANMYYLEFREDFLAICSASTYKKTPKKPDQKVKSSPHCKALILAVMESWTNYKRGRGEELFIYMSYPQWIDAMYGMFGRNVIIDSLDELVGDGLLSREPYRMYGKDSYKYKLECNEVNKRIRALPARDPQNIQPDRFTSKRDQFTNKRHTSLQKDGTRLLVNEDAFTKGRNIESVIESPQHQNIESKEESPATQPSISLFSQVEEEFLSWLKEKSIPRRKDVETVKQQIAFIRDRITTRERLHRYCDYAKDAYRGKTNPNVALGNLAAEWLLDGFLQAEQAFLPTNTPAPLETPSQADIEALAAEILREYPEIVLLFKTDEYGPYIEMPLSDDGSFGDMVRDTEDWRRLRDRASRLEPVLEYGRQRVMAA